MVNLIADSLDRMNVEFQKAGARGISLLYAAGDEGANCESDVYVPETPGSSPFVTAVGGTTGAEKEVCCAQTLAFSIRVVRVLSCIADCFENA